MVNVAVIDVLLTTVMLLTVMPVPLRAIVDPEAKSVPVTVTATAVPWTPLLGAIEVSVGAPELTVNVCEPLVLLPVVTVTFCGPVGALAAMVNVAVIDVLLTTAGLLTLMPVPLRLIVDPGPKFVPVSVTATAAPWMPLLGAIEVRVGLAVPPHPAMKTTGRSAIPRPRDLILPAMCFHTGNCSILTDIVNFSILQLRERQFVGRTFSSRIWRVC